ncbi:MAG: LysR family transcriptional regulator [Succinivibrio sp.]|nr:LysR family transcriptional regulator [Succinivibrio sp.]
MLLNQKIVSFITVCETRGVTRAAEQLHLSQPAVSTQLKELEQELGQKLFVKQGRELKLTAHGQYLYAHCRVMCNDEQQLRSGLLRLQNSPKTYNFGATMTIGEYVIPRALARLMQAEPQLRANLHIANTDSLLEALRQGRINFALLEGNFKPQGLAVRRFATVPFIAVCHREHVFAQEPVYLSSLLCERLICRESGSGTRSILEARLAQENLYLDSFRETIEVSGMHAILLMLKEDLGISFMYEPAARELLELGELKTIRLKNFALKHDFAFVWQEHSLFSSAYEQFCTQLKDYACL